MTTYKRRDGVRLSLEWPDPEQFSDVARYGIEENAMALLCDAIDGKDEDHELPAIPTSLYASYGHWEGLAEFLLKEAKATEDGWDVTYVFNSTIS